jgi:prepilin-type N-terminal cleavage/methylation domain-containing protein
MTAQSCGLPVVVGEAAQLCAAPAGGFHPKLKTANAKRFRTGFTLIELTVVIIIVSVLFVAAAERFLYWEERAEKASMESVLAGVKMGLQIRMAEMIMVNRQSGIVQLETENPMRWLQEQPSNYAGEYVAPPKPGYWYYANKEYQLVYVPHSSSYLDTGPGDRELRFRVAIRYETHTFTGGRSPVSVTLVTMRKFAWF